MGRARGEGRGRGESVTSRQVVVMGGTAGRRMSTLADLISSSGAQSLWQHGQFTAAGVPPSQFTVKTAKAFLPKPESAVKDALPRLVQHLQPATSKLNLLWAVTVSKAKITPAGLALVTATAIKAKKEGTNV